MNHAELERIARGMVAPGKGILAADESTGTIKKRFDAIAFESTEANRQLYREMLLAAPGINEAISGVILYDETLRQKTRAGVPFPKHLESLGIFPGINYLGVTLPLNPDAVFLSYLFHPGWFGSLDFNGERTIAVPIKNNPNLIGAGAFFAFMVLQFDFQLFAYLPIQASNPVFMQIQG